MAKHYPKSFESIQRGTSEKPTEVSVTLMRKVGPERFEVVTGVVRGTISDVKVIEKSVSLMVGRL
ncbi:MAG: hypothetical protein RL409_24, partial [Gemmatimonadota bacterium]